MDLKRVLLVAPAHDKVRAMPGKKIVWYRRIFRYSQQLGLLYVASSFPKEIEVRIADEGVEPIDFNDPAELVGITSMTVQAPRAYEIAAEFRRRGKKVILGGFHPTFMPEEAAEHADAVCVGEAENVIPMIVDDFRSGRLNGIYRNHLVDLSTLPIPDRGLLNQKAYVNSAIHASRGCDHDCHYCSESTFYGHRKRLRSVESLTEEMSRLGRNLLFLDSDIVADRSFAIRLFEVLKRLNKRWASQCSIEIADDPEMLKMAADSGCLGIFVGFESLSQKNLAYFNKRFNIAGQFGEKIKKIHDHGLAILASFMFGMDDDRPEVFDQTLRFLDRNRIEGLNALIMTPFPGTALYRQIDGEGRINDKNWRHYDFHHVIFKPAGMTADELQAGSDRLLREFYSTGRVLKRFSNPNRLGFETILKSVLPVNLSYWYNLSRNLG
jgi:radical SAM superfamily enzyme YgiQ (UPF0313 family)